MIFLATLLLMTSFVMNASEVAYVPDIHVSDFEETCVSSTHTSDSEAVLLPDTLENPYIIIHVINHTVRPILVSIDGLSREEEDNVVLYGIDGVVEDLNIVPRSEKEVVNEYFGATGPIRIFLRTISCNPGNVTITN